MTLQISERGGRGYCSRPGCGHHLGVIRRRPESTGVMGEVAPASKMLELRGNAWGLDDDGWRLHKRQRRPQRDEASDARYDSWFAPPGSPVECPRCLAMLELSAENT